MFLEWPICAGFLALAFVLLLLSTRKSREEAFQGMTCSPGGADRQIHESRNASRNRKRSCGAGLIARERPARTRSRFPESNARCAIVD
jgi:hypothetical protein